MDFLRSISRSKKQKQRDPEKAGGEIGGVANLAADLDLDPQTSRRISAFRLAVGIASTPSMTPKGGTSLKGRIASNLGLYQRVVRYERAAGLHYHSASKIISTALGIQIVVAAALTALGAADRGDANFHALGTGITILGAINTVIAGFLTYLKGSSLPNRYKYYEHEWRRVRELIEQRERDFLDPDCPLDVRETVDEIERMYLEVKSDIENSAPDSFISPSKVRRQEKRKEMALDESQITPPVRAAHTIAQNIRTKAEETIHGVAEEVEKKLDRVAAQVQTETRATIDEGTDSLKKELHNRIG